MRVGGDVRLVVSVKNGSIMSASTVYNGTCTGTPVLNVGQPVATCLGARRPSNVLNKHAGVQVGTSWFHITTTNVRRRGRDNGGKDDGGKNT